jgi:hypothetical protein
VLHGIRIVEEGVSGFDGQLAALRHGIARVDGYVEDRAFQLMRVGLRRPHCGSHYRLDLDLLA